MAGTNSNGTYIDNLDLIAKLERAGLKTIPTAPGLGFDGSGK